MFVQNVRLQRLAVGWVKPYNIAFVVSPNVVETLVTSKKDRRIT